MSTTSRKSRATPKPAAIFLAFDVGRKKTGIAVGNAISGGARPLAVASGGRNAQLQAAAKHIEEWQPNGLVVGLPKNMDGTEHAMTRESKNFAAQLRRRFCLPVCFVDERLSSRAARAANKATAGGHGVDAAAAAVILQQWLDEGAG